MNDLGLDVIDAMSFESIFGGLPVEDGEDYFENGISFLKKAEYLCMFDFGKQFVYTRSCSDMKTIMVHYDGCKFLLIVRIYAIKIFSGIGEDLIKLMKKAYAEITQWSDR